MKWVVCSDDIIALFCASVELTDEAQVVYIKSIKEGTYVSMYGSVDTVYNMSTLTKVGK